MTTKLVFACGGSGGHIFPALSVAEELERRAGEVSIFYVGGDRDIESEIFKSVPSARMISIESAPFRGIRSLCNPAFLIKLFTGFRQSIRFLKKEQPDLVAGFGGYFSFPVLLSAKLLGKKTMIHEQNVLPGVANKFLMRAADSVALSYEETQSYLPRHARLRVTGNPIRAFIERECRGEALDFFGFRGDKMTWLVLGGSQGAESINTFFLGALSLLPADLKSRMQVLHLCGRMRPEDAEAVFRREGVEGRAYSFFDRMDLAYGACDFALGRAGATFLAEIAAKRIPAILVPYPFAGGHQLENAKVYGRDHEAILIEQKDLTEEKLAKLLAEQIRRFAAPVSPGPGDLRDTPGEKGARGSARRLLADFILEAAAS